MKPNQVNHIDDKVSVRLLSASPVGPILFSASSGGLKTAEILTMKDLPRVKEHTIDESSSRIAEQAVSEMKAYFEGSLKHFTIPLDLDGSTDFQKRVLTVTKAIPFGKVLTYWEVAERIGKPQAARAVGGALARNPIGIVIPCHRVVAHTGQLHGYSSPNGIASKAVLLEHEGVQVKNNAVTKTDH